MSEERVRRIVDKVIESIEKRLTKVLKMRFGEFWILASKSRGSSMVSPDL